MSSDVREDTTNPIIWGLGAEALHAQFWAAHGVQVVRRGASEPLDPEARTFLLTETPESVVFDPSDGLELMAASAVDLLHLRLNDSAEAVCRERVVVGDRDHFIRVQRLYDGFPQISHGRLILTSRRSLAVLWQCGADSQVLRRRLTRLVPRGGRAALRVVGRFYELPACGNAMVDHLMRVWRDPGDVLSCAQRLAPGVWRHADAVVDPAARFVPPVWIGAGINVSAEQVIVGPTILWDSGTRVRESNAAPIYPAYRNLPHNSSQRSTRSSRGFYVYAKRAFDVVFAIFAILFTLPVYPIVLLAIYLESGRPFFFAQRRETLGGRAFMCLKFRSMRTDAESIKSELSKLNEADGPQFFMDNDPRLTRVGAVLRKLQLDELPQFFNVLAGQMSIVGPRPSPYAENQFCPPWRDARLSVRAGVTGLWQIMRTRANSADFQEWIRYDIEYVEHMGFKLDVWIVWRTMLLMLRPFLNLLRLPKPSRAAVPPFTVMDGEDMTSLTDH